MSDAELRAIVNTWSTRSQHGPDDKSGRRLFLDGVAGPEFKAAQAAIQGELSAILGTLSPLTRLRLSLIFRFREIESGAAIALALAGRTST